MHHQATQPVQIATQQLVSTNFTREGSSSLSPPSVTTLQAQANRCETQDSDLLANEELQTIQVALSGGRRHRRGNLSQTELETFHLFRRDVRSGSIPTF
ncbi:uncharacterized protein PG986_002883 [Apiospora aurea]|uniref:Uncharacterized protein n=1 Tax=Apiospora aurea TaxID=335848 RepID=A0ABR1QQ34_9PEZI